MSQQHGSGSGPSSTYTHDASANRPPTARSHTTPAGPPSAMPNLSGGAHFELPVSRGPALPPIHPPSEPTPPRSEGRTPRALGVHSILNPPQGEGSESKGQRRTASQMESPSPIERLSGSHAGYFPQPGPFGPGKEESRRPQSQTMAGGSHRRILSPRSPVYRSQSLGMIRPATGTINAQETPFLSPSSREYMIEPGSAPNPPLPTPPALHRAGYNFPPPPQIPTPPIPPTHSRQTSANVSQLSHSASASPSVMPYGHGGTNSPAQPHLELGRPRSPVPFPPGPLSLSAPSELEQRPFGIPVASTGQSNYQLLTLETNQGHVQIPVDVQAASKMADEKRKRNAGASARFRARRKEKEKEAFTTISRLEQQIRDLQEDVEFYRRERDLLAQIAYNAPGGDRHFPRPPSPRTRRVSLQASSGSGQGSNSTSSTPGAYTGYGTDQGPQRAAESERSVRRRTSTYLPPPQAAPGAQPQPPIPYPPTSYAALAAAAAAAATSVPHPRTPSGSLQQQPPPPPPQQPGFPSPYASERPERSWPPTSAPGRPGEP